MPTAGQALVHELLAASLQGLVVRGPMVGSEQAYVGTREWLGDPPEPVERADALARLARRYLAGHGPAHARDLAKWAGLTLGDARLGLAQISGEVVDRPEDLVDLAARRTAERALPPPRLLGAFDPLLLGWASREPFVGPHSVVTTNGLFRPIAVVGGRVVATWGLKGTTLSLRPLEPITRWALDALVKDATDVRRFLDLPAGNGITIEH